jgi:hypothetical protein
LADRSACEWWLRILPLPASPQQLEILVNLAFPGGLPVDSDVSVRASSWLNAQPHLAQVWKALASAPRKTQWLASLSLEFRASSTYRKFYNDASKVQLEEEASLLARYPCL